jgi:hypothetical protein
MADKLRRVVANPQLEILIINEKEGNIIKWIKYMQDVVLGDHFGAFFPDVVPNPERDRRVRWNALQLELKRKAPRPQACIEGMGMGSALASNHYDIVAPDDLVSEEAAYSAIVMEQAVETEEIRLLLKNLNTSEMPRVHAMGAMIRQTGCSRPRKTWTI